ncbi:sensor histidine kinase [Streptomyces sp. NPDC017454]|uniref:sensor histidine kinase n=1 Tax=Streptomyces sp. NPDC017454 TaxID=3364997 RepID=UPI0037A84149
MSRRHVLGIRVLGGLLFLAAVAAAVATSATAGFVIVAAGLLAVGAALAAAARLPRRPSAAGRLRLAVAGYSAAVTAVYRGPVVDATGWWWLLETFAMLALLVPTVRGTSGRNRTVVFAAVQALAIVVLPLRIGPYLAPPSDPAETGVLCLVWTLLAAGAIAAGGYLRGLDARRNRAIAAQRRRQRLEVACDLHDFASHDVMGVVVLVQAARVLAEEDPERAVELLPRIEEAGLQALAAMDRTVRALNEDDDGPPPGGGPDHRPNRGDEDRHGLVHRGGGTGGGRSADGGGGFARAESPLSGPPPTVPARPGHRVRDLSELPELAARFTRTGTVAARLDMDAGALDDLPGEVSALGHRIAVESLTNVRRHAATAAAVDLVVRRGPHQGHPALHLTVTDTGTPRSAPRSTPLPSRPQGGTGLAGLTARAQALGGSLTAGPHGETGWQVSVALPLPRSTAAECGPRDRMSPASEETTAV